MLKSTYQKRPPVSLTLSPSLFGLLRGECVGQTSLMSKYDRLELSGHENIINCHPLSFNEDEVELNLVSLLAVASKPHNDVNYKNWPAECLWQHKKRGTEHAIVVRCRYGYAYVEIVQKATSLCGGGMICYDFRDSIARLRTWPECVSAPKTSTHFETL